MSPEFIIIDTRQADELVTARETVYSGHILVGDECVDIDGKTDRDSDDWPSAVADVILATFFVTEEEVDVDVPDLIHGEIMFGTRYRVTPVDTPTRFDFDIEELEDERDKTTIWRVHAEKIAEDIANEILANFALVPHLGKMNGKSSIREYLTRMNLQMITETLELREEA